MPLPFEECGEDGEPTKENILPVVNQTSIKKSDLPFSYNITQPLFRREKRNSNLTWSIYEKGSEKSNPEKLTEISYDAIRTALREIREHILRTPLYKLERSELIRNEDFQIYLKKECDQNTNSIKARGVVYTLLKLSNEQKRKGVIAISTGNFAQTLCYYGTKLKIPITVVIPTSIPHEIFQKVQDKVNQWITVLCRGSDMVEAHKAALYIAMKNGLFYLDGNDHPCMIIGQATLGMEITEQMTDVDAVVLPTPIDGCGLTLGIAIAIKMWNPKIKVFEVQCTIPNHPIEEIRRQTTSHEELQIPVGKSQITKIYPNRGLTVTDIDKVITVNAESISTAAHHLLEKENIVDTYAPMALAAFLTHQLDELRGKRVIIPLYGKMDFDKVTN